MKPSNKVDDIFAFIKIFRHLQRIVFKQTGWAPILALSKKTDMATSLPVLRRCAQNVADLTLRQKIAFCALTLMST